MTFAEFRQARLTELLAEERVYGGGGADPGQNKVEGLIELLHFTGPQSVIELGCCRGVSTEIFLLHCPRVCCVDSWDGIWSPMMDEFIHRVEGYPNLGRVIRGTSADSMRLFEPGSFDMCYIDADHDYQSVVDDITACKPLVRPGGWIAGHDHTPDSDVERAVKELLGEPKVFSDTSWLIKNKVTWR